MEVTEKGQAEIIETERFGNSRDLPNLIGLSASHPRWRFAPRGAVEKEKETLERWVMVKM